MKVELAELYSDYNLLGTPLLLLHAAESLQSVSDSVQPSDT